MRDKQKIKLIKLLIEDLDISPCKELNLECTTCKFIIIKAHLEWYLELLEYKWFADFVKQK